MKIPSVIISRRMVQSSSQTGEMTALTSLFGFSISIPKCPFTKPIAERIDLKTPHSTITSVPAPISRQPTSDFTVNCSCRKRNARASVMSTDSLSMGTTFETSPSCSAL